MANKVPTWAWIVMGVGGLYIVGAARINAEKDRKLRIWKRCSGSFPQVQACAQILTGEGDV